MTCAFCCNYESHLNLNANHKIEWHKRQPKGKLSATIQRECARDNNVHDSIYSLNPSKLSELPDNFTQNPEVLEPIS